LALKPLVGWMKVVPIERDPEPRIVIATVGASRLAMLYVRVPVRLRITVRGAPVPFSVQPFADFPAFIAPTASSRVHPRAPVPDDVLSTFTLVAANPALVEPKMPSIDSAPNPIPRVAMVLFVMKYMFASSAAHPND
jgi:hypothetical protein